MKLDQLLKELKKEPLRAMDEDAVEFAATLPTASRDFQQLRAMVKTARTVQMSAWENAVKRCRDEANADAVDDLPEASDLQHAELFATEYRAQLRFINERGWYRFAEGRWEYREWEAQTLASVFAHKLVRQARERGDAEAASHVASRRGIESVVALARSNRTLCAQMADFDNDPMLLNVRNGTINLRTGKLNPHNPEDMLTRRVEIDYDEAAQCPLWKAFLDRVQPDPSVQKYLQRMMGYNLTGQINEQIFNIWHGSGANGKSTALEILQYCLGDYSRILPSEMLLNRTHEPHPTERAQLMGLRLAAFEETKKGKAFDENTVKQLVGQGTLTARFMRQDNFEFTCTHKVVVCTNHRPKVSDCSHGFWRRTHLLPWLVEIPDAEKDRTLGQKLRNEAAGILRWMVQGCLEYQRVGLAPPEAVLIATAEYQAESDAVGLFLAERTRRDSNGRVRAGEIYKAWKEWCEARGEYTGSQTTFGESLRGRFEKLKSCGVIFYTGLRMWEAGQDGEEEDSPPPSVPSGNSHANAEPGKGGTVAPPYARIGISNTATSETLRTDSENLLSLDSLKEGLSHKSQGESEGMAAIAGKLEEVVLGEDGGFDL